LSIDELARAMIDRAREAGAVSCHTLSYLEENFDRLGDVNDIWQAMDEEWDRCGASFNPENQEAVSRFYASPVWTLNGLFTEVDPISVGHRRAIAEHISRVQPKVVVDYGGGFGSLARQVAQRLPEASVILVEPYPSEFALLLAQDHANMEIRSELPERCDVIVAQDVLEHVLDPICDFAMLLGTVAPGGLAITANCFKPVIKCHNPGAFHLNFTFKRVTPPLGCNYVGKVLGAEHAEIYQRTRADPSLEAARLRERLSKGLYPVFVCLQKVNAARRQLLR